MSDITKRDCLHKEIYRSKDQPVEYRCCSCDAVIEDIRNHDYWNIYDSRKHYMETVKQWRVGTGY